MLLAQFNVARLLAPLTAPEMVEFVLNLELVNTAAESAPGFVWRNVAEGRDDATTIAPFEDPMIITNLSVWTSIDELGGFVRSKAHWPFVLRRREWFDQLDGEHQVLWWIPQLHLPSIDEAMGRLDMLQTHGPTPRAFTFKDRFEPE